MKKMEKITTISSLSLPLHSLPLTPKYPNPNFPNSPSPRLYNPSIHPFYFTSTLSLSISIPLSLYILSILRYLFCYLARVSTFLRRSKRFQFEFLFVSSGAHSIPICCITGLPCG